MLKVKNFKDVIVAKLKLDRLHALCIIFKLSHFTRLPHLVAPTLPMTLVSLCFELTEHKSELSMTFLVVFHKNSHISPMLTCDILHPFVSFNINITFVFSFIFYMEFSPYQFNLVSYSFLLIGCSGQWTCH